HVAGAARMNDVPSTRVWGRGMPSFLKHWHRMSLADQRSAQAHRLRAFLRNQVVPFSPHYRRKFEEWKLDPDEFRSLDDLKRLPFTTKQDLLPSPENPKGPLEFVLTPSEELIRTALPKPQMLRMAARRLRFGE